MAETETETNPSQQEETTNNQTQTTSSTESSNSNSSELPKNVGGEASNNDEVDPNSLPELSDAYAALIDEGDIQYFENSRSKMIISVYAVNKGLGIERINKDYCFKLPLKSVIRNIVIKQDIYNFGTSCTMIVSSNNNNLSYILERPELWHIVINVGIPIDEENTTSFYRLEPYIFDIDKILTIGHESNVDIFTLELDDIYSSIAKHRSWASLVKWYNQIMQSSSYTDIVYNIFQYLNDILRLETHNTFSFKKELYAQVDSFTSPEIVATSLKKIKPAASIYEGLKSIWNDIQVSFDYNEGFMASYETIPQPAVPVIRAFFQEEYVDPCNVYTTILQNLIDEQGDEEPEKEDNNSSTSTASNNITTDANSSNSTTNGDNTNTDSNSNNSTVSELPKKKNNYSTNITNTLKNNNNILKRIYTLRSMYHPFALGFSLSDEDIKGTIWEVINCPTEKLKNDPEFRIFSNIVSSPVKNYTKYPLDPSLTYKSWKNYVFQTETCVSGGKGQFVFFNWVKSLFEWSFLGNNDRKNDCFIVPIVPGFSVLETEEDRQKTSPSIVNFNEGNCVVKPIKTPAFEQEVMWNIGKELSSMILYNNEYSFDINGSWLRRPNEIIKLYASSEDNNKEMQNDEIFTDIFGNKFVMLYMISVSHVIDCIKNSFTDKVHTLKACEYLR